jgi:RimJ/RimL family protein N-acetyltransferase
VADLILNLKKSCLHKYPEFTFNFRYLHLKKINQEISQLKMDKAAFDLQPQLENHLLVLRPLREEDFEDLYKVASDPLIWEQHPSKDRCRKDVFELFFKEAMASTGSFAIMDKKTNQIIGSTRFHSIKETQNAIEIGWTFLAREYWGGFYNQTMKYLMIEYAFNFVENILFYIHEENTRSQKAVEKIGAKRITSLEGKVLETRPNASVIYNITKKSWKPNAK